MIAISVDDVSEYVMERDRKLAPEQQTVLLLRPMPYGVQRKFLSIVGSNLSVFTDASDAEGVPEKAMQLPLGEIVDIVVPAGLRGWRNFKDKNGKDVVWKANGHGAMEERLLQLFDLTALVELVGAIVGLSFITEEDRKN